MISGRLCKSSRLEMHGQMRLAVVSALKNATIRWKHWALAFASRNATCKTPAH